MAARSPHILGNSHLDDEVAVLQGVALNPDQQDRLWP